MNANDAPSKARPLAPASIAEWPTGWRVVLGAGVGMGTGVSLYIYVSSIFIAPVGEAFGWSRGDLALGGMISYVMGAAALPLIGRFTDRFGFRRVAIVCALSLACVYAATALMPNAYWYYLMLMIVGGVFGGGTASLVWTRPVIATFERQRGLALGFATAGTSIAAMGAPLVLAGVIDEGGWRAGFFALAAITGLIGMPLALWLIGRAGERVAEAAVDVDAAAAPGVQAEVRAGRTRSQERDVSLGEAVRGVRFWLLVLAIMCINIPGSGVLGQLAPMVGDFGLSSGEVATVMSTYAAGLLTGRVLTGFALDRVPAFLVGAVTTLVPAVGIVMLMTPELSFALAAIAVGLIGMQQGAEADLFAYFISRNFGLKHYGAIYGVVMMAGALSTAAALVLFGEMHDVTGSYDLALVIGAVLFCVGAVAFGAMGRSRPPSVIPALRR
ncbi:MAG TPA: MFS transporter [Candidatus Binatia bacterium]|nr:MFS transporter [Candidatus Binatia bacterium]